MNLQFFFEEGEGVHGETLTWVEAEKKKYVDDFLGSIWDIWNEAFTIKTDSSATTIKEVKVHFHFSNMIEGTWINDHWELEVTKVDKWVRSEVNPGSGNVTIDSDDPFYTFKSGQREAAHEFGHLLGLADEYLNNEGEPEENPHWIADFNSIMYLGEDIRARHFTPFAYWLTEQYEDLSEWAGTEIVFYVDDGAGGKWTVDGGSGYKKAKLK
jgi:hypothetical protein